ncbi:DUF1611 domain-containing protein [Kitasatospora sp. NBC_00240]|uniref:DUF1611 domain-containing protein n=1 Tax=Kitasatospora sp. NBC_00240 TaxID=2903567 RepID=UPI00225853D3|nr:DUF1611 domain-containing protein [Kitasatospora sp. NBC_00240]MCX5210089.1 DUF1611 domain-containing protein [Kitasatospora sp. NBC_00240]
MDQLNHAELVNRKFVLFAEGCFGLFSSKIAASLLRYRADSCVAVIDGSQAGRTVQDVLGYGGSIPVVAGLDEVLHLRPEVLIIGKGLHSAELPADWKPHLLSAVRNGLHLVNSIHFRLTGDPDIARAVAEKGVTVWETKDAPEVPLNKARVLDLDSWIIHTCGSDSNIGKKTAALQIYQEANRRGIPTGFAATGQSGMMISGHGVAVDGVPGDFMGGSVEQVVLEAAVGNDWVVVEGQGSLNHIAASGVALAILHGALPNALVFCHRLGAERTKVWDTPIIPIPELIRMNEELTVFERPAKVAAVSVNSAGFTEEEYRREADKLAAETGLPVVDPVRPGGAARLVDILRDHQRANADVAAIRRRG